MTFRYLIILSTTLFLRSAHAAEVSSPRHAIIASDKGMVVRYDAHGKVAWIYSGVAQVHTLQQLKNGNILCQKDWQTIIEITPGSDVVWTYDATTNGNEGRKVEVHAFQRLANGNTMIVENGIGRILEVDAAGDIQHEMKYRVNRLNAHSDVRMAHQLENGHYLLAHENEGHVTEYNHADGIVWNYDVPLFDNPRKPGHGPKAFGNQVYNALRLRNGNTLIATWNAPDFSTRSYESQVR